MCCQWGQLCCQWVQVCCQFYSELGAEARRLKIRTRPRRKRRVQEPLGLRSFTEESRERRPITRQRPIGVFLQVLLALRVLGSDGWAEFDFGCGNGRLAVFSPGGFRLSFGFPRGFQVDLDSHADSQADSECCESVTKKLRIPALVDSQPRGFPPRSIHKPKLSSCRRIVQAMRPWETMLELCDTLCHCRRGAGGPALRRRRYLTLCWTIILGRNGTQRIHSRRSASPPLTQ